MSVGLTFRPSSTNRIAVFAAAACNAAVTSAAVPNGPTTTVGVMRPSVH